jgi:hypothetical protein
MAGAVSGGSEPAWEPVREVQAASSAALRQ